MFGIEIAINHISLLCSFLGQSYAASTARCQNGDGIRLYHEGTQAEESGWRKGVLLISFVLYPCFSKKFK